MSGVKMIDYLTEVGCMAWPDDAEYCRMFNGGAQFFDRSGKECAFMPFWDAVFVTNRKITKLAFLQARLAKASAYAEKARQELDAVSQEAEQ